MLLLSVMMVMALCLTNSFARIARTTPSLDKLCWNRIDNEIDRLTGPLHHLLGMDAIDNNEAGKQYAETVSAYLESQP